MKILGAQIDAAGKATVDFSLADANGVPLDRQGVFTPGAVAPRFVLAYLNENAPGDPLQYTAYTVNAASQASSDTGGTFTTVDLPGGLYRYEFKTAIKIANPDLTHTLGAWAGREVDGTTYVANANYDFVPSGAAVVTKRELLDQNACNACHGKLQAHGGQRRDVNLCVLCHQPQSVDPDTGNTVDFKVMVHKIHRGADLPSVVAGGKYEIIGYQNSVNDYSTVAYPQDIRICETCHAGPQKDAWNQHPTRDACGSCHDGTSFVDPAPAGMTLHTGGAMADDSKCTVCHKAGGLEDIAQKHSTPLTDPAAPKFEASIQSVASTAPGQTPVITFAIKKNGQPLDILANPLTRLRVTYAGPTTEITTRWQSTIQGTGANGTLSPIDAANGVFQYVAAAAQAIPASATGSYMLGLEGYYQPDATQPRYVIYNPVAYFAVTDAQPVARREVVDEGSCKSCHYQLAMHGGARNNPNYCVTCHNTTLNNLSGLPRFEDSVARVPETFDFKVFIHKLHRGDKLTQPYFIGSGVTVANPGGTQTNMGEARFPGDLRNCQTCHKPGTNAIPLGKNVLGPQLATRVCTESPAADADSYCQTESDTPFTMPPMTAVCTSCHDADYTAAHAELNTTASGVESCPTCHGPGKLYDIAIPHQTPP
jgi:OmcA/MtrC family decaheme c-type cytochrome